MHGSTRKIDFLITTILLYELGVHMYIYMYIHTYIHTYITYVLCAYIVYICIYVLVNRRALVCICVGGQFPTGLSVWVEGSRHVASLGVPAVRYIHTCTCTYMYGCMSIYSHAYIHVAACIIIHHSCTIQSSFNNNIIHTCT